MYNIFGTKNHSIKKWRSRAWSIDPQKTKLTINAVKRSIKNIPPWIDKKNLILNLISS